MRGLAIALLAGLIPACAGATSVPAPLTRPPDVAPLPAQIVDQTLAARPTMPASATIAYHVEDERLAAAVEEMLEAVPRVRRVVRLPSLLLTGRRPFDAEAGPRAPLDVDRLRLVAARVGADAVLYVDYGVRSSYRANGLAALSVVILPVLFLPLQDAESESFVDAILVDTRTGRELAHLHERRADVTDYVTVFSHAADELAEEQRTELLAETKRVLTARIAELPRPKPAGGATATALPSDTTDPWDEPRHVDVGLAVDGTVTVEDTRSSRSRPSSTSSGGTPRAAPPWSPSPPRRRCRSCGCGT